MTATPTDLRPPWARYMWFDSEHIYIEMPVTDGPPIILKERWTEAGLNKMLHLMKRTAEVSAAYQGKNGWEKPHPIVRRPRDPAKPKPEMSTESRSTARNILKKLGMIS